MNTLLPVKNIEPYQYESGDQSARFNRDGEKTAQNADALLTMKWVIVEGTLRAVWMRQ